MTRVDKRVKWELSKLLEYDTNDNVYALTEAQAMALLTVVSRQMTWSTRWEDYQTDRDSIELFVAELGDRLMTPIDICELIQNCIRDNDGTRGLIMDLVYNSEEYNVYSPLSNGILQQALPIADNCTDQHRWATSIAIVQIMHTLSNDLLERIELTTNQFELLVALSDNVEVSSTTIANALEIANWLQDSIGESYNASYTPSVEQQIANAIYCAFDGCTITFDDITNEYSKLLTQPITLYDSLEAVIDWLIGITTSDTELRIVSAMHAFVLHCMRFGSNIVEVENINVIVNMLNAVKDDTLALPVDLIACPTVPCVELILKNNVGESLIFDSLNARWEAQANASGDLHITSYSVPFSIQSISVISGGGGVYITAHKADDTSETIVFNQDMSALQLEWIEISATNPESLTLAINCITSP